MKRYRRKFEEAEIKSIKDIFNEIKFIVNFYISNGDVNKIKSINGVVDVDNSTAGGMKYIVKVKCEGFSTLEHIQTQILGLLEKNGNMKVDIIKPKM